MTRSRAVGLLIVTSLLWSTSGVLIKSIHWNPIAICGVRGLIAIVTLYLLSGRNIVFGRSIEQIRSAVAYAATVLSFVAATKLTTSANAIFLQYTAPIYVALFGHRFLGEKTTRKDWVAVIIVLFGMFLFFFDDLSRQYVLGNVIAVISGIAFAWSTLEMRRQKTGSPEATFVLGNLISFAISIPFLEPIPVASEWRNILLLGIFQLGLAGFFYTQAVKHVRAMELIMIPFLEPVLNPIWVLWMMGEKPGPLVILGGVIILSSVMLRAFR